MGAINGILMGVYAVVVRVRGSTSQGHVSMMLLSAGLGICIMFPKIEAHMLQVIISGPLHEKAINFINK